MAFDPNKHLIQLQGKDYLEVKWRLVWLRADHPEATIATEIIAFDVADQWAVIRATVSLPTGASATGMVFQKPTGKAADWIANGETSAIGRALGALGYGTQFCPDFDQGEQVVDSPIDRKPMPTAHELAGKPEPKPPAKPVPPPPVVIDSTAEVKRAVAETLAVRNRLNKELLGAMAEKNMPQSQVATTIKDVFGVVRTGDLTDDQMADVIGWVRDAKELRYGPDGKATLVEAGPGTDDGQIALEDLAFETVPTAVVPAGAN